jgi:hypothetical protein
MWAPLARDTHDFHFTEAVAAALTTFTASELRTLFTELTQPSGHLRRKLVIRVVPQLNASDTATKTGLLGGGPSFVEGDVIEPVEIPLTVKAYESRQGKWLPTATTIRKMITASPFHARSTPAGHR